MFLVVKIIFFEEVVGNVDMHSTRNSSPVSRNKYLENDTLHLLGLK